MPQQQQQQQRDEAPSCVFLQVDLSQPAEIQAVPQQLRGLGVNRVKTLVNNAGIADPYMPPAAADGSNMVQRAALWNKYIAG
jgi:NAD(P)-dependent dehydrogenase (short-subunit alcohol dehydrogenase family)